VAYVVPREGAEVSAAQLRAELEQRLPDYMVPSAFVVMKAFPLTPSGKLDRKALPAPDYGLLADRRYEAPIGATETALAHVWQDLLRVERVGRHDNFYELGGDSIVAMQVVARAARAGVFVGVRDVIECQTVAVLATRHRGAGTQRDQDEVSGEFLPLPIHREMFTGDFDALHRYNMSMLFEVGEDFTETELRAIVAALYRRHDALRIRFRAEGGEIVAWHAPLSDALIAKSCVSEMLPADADAYAANMLACCDRHQASLHLVDGPLFRTVLIGGVPGRKRLFVVAHHGIFDSVSWRIVLADMEMAHAQLARGTSIALPPKTSAYQAWGRALRAASLSLHAELGFWRDQCGASTRMPTDFATVTAPTAATTAWFNVEVSSSQTNVLLKHAPSVFDAQAKDLLLAAVYIAVRRWSGRHEFLVQMESHGRESGIEETLDLTQTVGWFTAAYPLRLHCADEDIAAVTAAVKTQSRSVPNNGIGYGVLKHFARAEGLQDDIGAHAIVFNYLGQFDRPAGEDGYFKIAAEATGNTLDLRRARPYLIGIQGGVLGGKLNFAIDYSNEQYRAERIDALAAELRSALASIAAAAEPARLTLTAKDFA